MENFDSLIAEILEVDEIDLAEELTAFECWDSLTILSIIAFTDEEYGVNLSADDVTGAGTVLGLKDLIKSNM